MPAYTYEIIIQYSRNNQFQKKVLTNNTTVPNSINFKAIDLLYETLDFFTFWHIVSETILKLVQKLF